MIENRYHKILRDNNQDIISLSPANQTLRAELALELKKILEEKPDVKILEIGVGEGDLTKYILQHNPDLKLDCLDISREMLDSAKIELGKYIARNTIMQEPKNINFIQGDACEYLDNPETRPYGIILSAWTIHNFPKKDQKRIFEKIYDKLQDGGMMMIMDKIYTGDFQTDMRLFLIQKIRYERYLSKDVEAAIAAHEMQDIHANYKMEESQTKEVLEEIGFTEVDILARIERDVLLIAKK